MRNCAISATCKMYSKRVEKIVIRKETQRGKQSWLIKISHLLVIPTKLEREDFKGVTSIHERDREESIL